MSFNFGKILQFAAPLILQTIPGKPGDITRKIGPSVISAIVDAQKIPGATGQEKKAHVLAIANDALDVVDASGIEMPRQDALVAVSSAVDTIVATAHVIDGTHKAVRALPPTPAGLGNAAGV